MFVRVLGEEEEADDEAAKGQQEEKGKNHLIF